MANPLFWSDRRVVVTGHTGFKGTWLATWLAEMGARVTGIGRQPATAPSLFACSDLADRIEGSGPVSTPGVALSRARRFRLRTQASNSVRNA